MKNCLLYILLLSVFISCGDKRKLIPEDELGDIIVRSVVTESFLKNTGRLEHNHNVDSLNFYLPILDEYNYTVEDLEYTITRMVQRKSDIFGSLMDKISGDVSLIKNHYEAQSDMGRNWRKKIDKEIIDTLYFSPDSIHVKSYKDLKNLDFRIPINADGKLIVKYNYKVSLADSNYSRYFTYAFLDSSNISKKSRSRNSYWLSKGKSKLTFEKEIPIEKSYKNNYFTMRILSYVSKDEMPHKNAVKSVDFYVDSITILFKPEYKVGDKRMLEKVGKLQLLTNIKYLIEDSVAYKVPYSREFSGDIVINPDSIRYNRVLPIGKDPRKVERLRKKKADALNKKRLDDRRKKELVAKRKIDMIEKSEKVDVKNFKKKLDYKKTTDDKTKGNLKEIIK